MSFKNILVNAAFPYTSGDVAIQAVSDLTLAKDARITVFDVSSDLSWAMQYLVGNWETLIEKIAGTKKKGLMELADSLVSQGRTATSVLAEGRLSTAIIDQVRAEGHDLVVKVAEDHSANRSGLIGSTDIRLIHDCPCPVLILRPDEKPGFQNAAVAVDVLDRNKLQRSLDKQALRVVGEIVDSDRSSYSLVYALPMMQSSLTVADADKDVVSDERLRQWDTELGEAAQSELTRLSQEVGRSDVARFVLRGQPESSIPEFVNSHSIDLLVIGSVARKGLEGFFLGNTAERILERVTCSVLVLKPTSNE